MGNESSGGGGGSGGYGGSYGSNYSGWSSSAMAPATVPTYTGSYGSCSANTSWGQTAYTETTPSDKCLDAQRTADSLCENAGNTPFGGYTAAVDSISQGLRCTAAQDHTDKVCGK